MIARRQALRIGSTAAAAAALTGCGFHFDHVATGKTETDLVNFDKDKAEMVRLDIQMPAGELKVHGGSNKLMEGQFRYNVPEWKPEVRYDSTGFRGTLSIKQGGRGGASGNITNEWDVRLAEDVPLDIEVRMGAGEGKLDLRNLTLRNVEIHIGAGEMDVDLRSAPKRSFELIMRGGVGEGTVRVPRDASVIAEAKGGIGSINVTGLRKTGNSTWESESYGKNKATIRVDVKGGIGEINIRAE